MVTFSALMRRLSCLLVSILFASCFTAAYAQVQTNPAGTVGYTTRQTFTTGVCEEYAYSGWYFKDSLSQTHTFSGTGAETICPVYTHVPNQYDDLTATSSDGLYSITTSGSTGVVVLAGVQGYIDPKYVVLGVTYAPPGLNSYVTYTDSQAVATTVSLANSFTNSTNYSVSISIHGSMPGFKGGLQVTNSDTATQTTKDSKSVTLSWSTANAIKTGGTPNSFAPVNNDYDLVYVWLNPVEVFTASGNNLTWNGYGYDANDQNGMDIVAIPIGYLNGDFGAMPDDITALTNRTWASGQQFASGQSAALNSTDFAIIATYDPFSNAGYGIDDVGFTPPNPSTLDNRFTLTTCNSGNSISYEQPSPGQIPSVYTCTLNYSNLTSSAQDITVSNSTTFSLDLSFTEGKIVTVTEDFKYASTQTTTTESNNSISNTQASSAVASITSPACGSNVAPCNPVYDGSGNEPVEFNIYQDNMYGTFMFAPVHYY